MLFTKKENLKRIYFERGVESANKKFEKQKIEIEEVYKKEKKQIKTRVNKIINEKNLEINKRDKKINSISKYLTKLSDTVASFKAAGLMIERESKVEILEAADKNSKDMKVTSTIDVLCREFNSILPKIENKVEEYKLEFLN